MKTFLVESEVIHFLSVDFFFFKRGDLEGLVLPDDISEMLEKLRRITCNHLEIIRITS